MAHSSYAAGTSVSVQKSKFELDALLQRHGATQRGYFDDDTKGEAVVAFTLRGRQYRLVLPLPKFDSFATREVKRGHRVTKERTTPELQRKLFEQASRERWRLFVLLVKAKLEVVALGITSAEHEFLADLVLPNGQGLHDALKKPVEEMYITGGPLLLGPASATTERKPS